MEVGMVDSESDRELVRAKTCGPRPKGKLALSVVLADRFELGPW